MPLPSPILDDRSYQQLRDELVRRIPVYNPEWTDFNASDPGITLIELFAFLGENLLFRFNQIPETTRLAFLDLLQIPLQPAGIANALVALSDPALLPGEAAVRLDLGASVSAGSVAFELRTEVNVLPWDTTCVARLKSLAPSSPEALSSTVDVLHELDIADDAEIAFYSTVAVTSEPSAPDAEPVDFGAAVDGIVWIAVKGSTDSLDGARAKLINVGFIPDESIQSISDALEPCGTRAELGARSVPCAPVSAEDAQELVWEISTGRLTKDNAPIYAPLTLKGDTTNGLRQRGVARLAIPDRDKPIGTFAAPEALRGTGMFPPRLEDPKEDARVLFWIRAYHRASERRFGRVLWVGINAGEARHQKKAFPEYLASGTAQAGQRCALLHGSVISRSLVLEIEEQPGRWVRWTEVASFDASREDDKHYTLDLESGHVRFGNSVQGYAPQLGQRIRATEYRYGGGLEGNVPAKALTKVEGIKGGDPRAGRIKSVNPVRASGGAAAESVGAGLERLPGELRRHDRAVTASDFREIALATPGGEVGRAECLPLFNPNALSVNAPGSVSVVVFPVADAKHPSAPMPERTTLRAVCEYLDARRLITTELYVIPPSYVKVAVAFGNVHIKPGYGVDAVRSWIEQVVRQYLSPLPPYGPDGGGWPLGRPIYAPELEAVALQVEGLEFIDEGGVAVARFVDGVWQKGKVTLLRHEVPELVSITVVTGIPLEPGAGYVHNVPSVIVPIPVIQDEC